MHAWMYVCMYVRMYVCMYVCICTYSTNAFIYRLYLYIEQLENMGMVFNNLVGGFLRPIQYQQLVLEEHPCQEMDSLAYVATNLTQSKLGGQCRDPGISDPTSDKSHDPTMDFNRKNHGPKKRLFFLKNGPTKTVNCSRDGPWWSRSIGRREMLPSVLITRGPSLSILTWRWVKMEDLGDHRCECLV